MGVRVSGGLLTFSFSSGNDRVLKKPVLSSEREAVLGADSVAELSTSPVGLSLVETASTSPVAFPSSPSVCNSSFARQLGAEEGCVG